MMGASVLPLLLANLLAVVMFGKGSESASLKISPDRCIAAMDKSVDITCKVDDAFAQLTNETTLIKVSRNDEMPIAYLRHCGNVTLGNNLSSQFTAEGHIGKGSDSTYLRLTLANPRSEDTGIYTCVLYYVDGNGVLQQEKRNHNLVVEKLDVASLESVLTQIQQKLSQIDHFSQNTAKHLVTLEEKTDKRGNDLVAFSATKHSASFLFEKGDDVIFPEVMMEKGEGYDPSSGIFTAPKTGLYVFHLVVRMEKGNYRMSIDLLANGKQVARLYAGDQSYPDQSAVDGVVYLAAGDKVKAVVDGIYGTGNMQGFPYSIFSGYLVSSN